MPELRSPYGYPAVMAGMGATCAVLWWRFRRARWL
jgi:magnesium transporter